MKKLFKSLIITAALVMGGFLVAPGTVLAADDAKSAACEGVGIVSGSGCAPDATPGAPTIDSTVQLAVNILSWIVGILSVIMIIIGGFKYVISSGDSGNITGAKNTIIYALVGLVVVALAQVIVRFVLNKASPVPATPTSMVIKLIA